MRRSLAVLLTLVLTATACGGSTTADTAPADEAEAATTTEAETTTTTEAATTTTTTEAETTTTTEAPEPAPSDDAVVSAYCAAAAEVDATLDAADLLDPVALEEALVYQVDTMSAVDAPAEIEADIQTMLVTSDEYLQILEDADFDITVAEDEITALFERPDVDAATTNIESFELENCPLAVDDEFEPSPNDLGLTEDDVRELLADPAGREGIIEGLTSSTELTPEEASCFLDETDASVVVGLFAIGVGQETTIDPAVATGMIEGLTACGLTLDVFG